MAIEPEYLGALERFYIRATDLLITNVRPDHQEQLGDRPDAMALAIARALPAGGRVFVTAEAATPFVREEAQRLRCELIIVDDVEGDPEERTSRLRARSAGTIGIDDKVADAAHARRTEGHRRLHPAVR